MAGLGGSGGIENSLLSSLLKHASQGSQVQGWNLLEDFVRHGVVDGLVCSGFRGWCCGYLVYR